MAQLAVSKVKCIESSDTYGHFIAEPLEKGYGITLGNALRRVLLGSLPGAAVTWVKIEGIQHQFSTIPHVKEDTIDFLLNVKALRLRPLAQRPGKLILEVQGEGEVCAADIKPSADFHIVNPELHLVTLDSPEANLYVEFNVELGRGYVPSSSSDGLPIGVIPVDAIFTPVRKVNYLVEPARVGQESNYERLILQIWTDDTLSPTDAITQGAIILIEQFSAFRELTELVEEAGLPHHLLVSSQQYNMSVEELNFSTRVLNSLRRQSITTLGQLLEKSKKGLPSLPGLGAKSQEEVERVLKELGLSITPPPKVKKGEK